MLLVLWLLTGVLLGLSLGRIWIAHSRPGAANSSTSDRPNSPLAGAATQLELDAHSKPATPAPNAEALLSDDESDKHLIVTNRYRVLTENLAAAVVIRDQDSKITYCSPYTELLTGYAISEIYAANPDFFLDIIHDQDKQLYGRALHYTKVGEPFEFRYRFHHKTGIEMWAETRTVPILDADGLVTSSLSITIDATRTVRQQLQLEEKNKDLEDFAYMISHDLKAPIFTLKGIINILKEDHSRQLEGEAHELLEHLLTATNRIEQLVSSVLEFSKLSTQENRNEAVPLSQVFSDILQDYGRQLDACGGTLSIDTELPVLTGDRLKLYQIFGNLVGNAIKYHSEHRPLHIGILSSSEPGERQIRVVVTDNGMGIPHDKLSSIFRPFQRAHGSEIEGSGIGLACVKKLLEKIGGSIEVRSELDKGSSFEVMLKKR